MTEQIVDLILKQVPIVILLIGIVYWQIKEKKQIVIDCKLVNKEYREQLHILNEHLRDREKEQYVTLNDLIVIIEDIEINQKIIITTLKNRNEI